MKPQWTGVVGDVGGTNARFALVDENGHVRHARSYPAREHASLVDALAAFIGETARGRCPSRAVIAAAGPVVDGGIELTNLGWQVSELDLIGRFDLEAVRLINDFAAQAMACPVLDDADRQRLGPSLPAMADGPIVVLGAGTGFGVAALARGPRGDVPIATEGGHAGFAPGDEVEAELWTCARRRHGRVSIERLLSGRGLFDIYRDLAARSGAEAPLADEAAVMQAGLAGDLAAGAALDRFAAILGSVAGDLALTYGARGGVYIAGGIAPRMGLRLAGGAFRARFEAKGRMSSFVEAIPTWLVIHPYPALIGAARMLAGLERL